MWMTVVLTGMLSHCCVQVNKRGVAPLGGGEVTFSCPTRQKLQPVQLISAGKVRRIRGIAYPYQVINCILSDVSCMESRPVIGVCGSLQAMYCLSTLCVSHSSWPACCNCVLLICLVLPVLYTLLGCCAAGLPDSTVLCAETEKSGFAAGENCSLRQRETDEYLCRCHWASLIYSAVSFSESYLQSLQPFTSHLWCQASTNQQRRQFRSIYRWTAAAIAVASAVCHFCSYYLLLFYVFHLPLLPVCDLNMPLDCFLLCVSVPSLYYCTVTPCILL